MAQLESAYLVRSIRPFGNLELHKTLLGPTVEIGSTVELRIRLREDNINIRQLNSFLRLIDRAYGRLISRDLRTYAFEKDMQLHAECFRSGSLEILISQIVSQLPNATPLLVLFLILKLLPPGAQKLSTAYNNLQQGLLARSNRKILRSKISLNKKLMDLPPNIQKKIVALVDDIVRDEPTVGKESQEFASSHLLDVTIKVHRRIKKKK